MSIAQLNAPLVAAPEFNLRLSAKAVYVSLLTCVVVLAVMSTVAKLVMMAFPADQYGAVNELCKRFYLDFENNIPAWFSSIGLFVCSGLLGLIAAIHSQIHKADHWPWLGLASLFLGLAIDEATYVHEILIVSLRDKWNLTGIFYFAWVIPGACFVLGIVTVYFRFVWRLPKFSRIGLIVACMFYVGGALVMELLGGLFAESAGYDSWSYVTAMTVEETLELVGISTMIYVLICHIGTVCPHSMRLSVQ